MTISYETLKEPVRLDDVCDHLEYMEVSAETMRMLFERYKFMCGGQDNWVSLELWRIYTMAKEATDALDRLRQVPGVFPKD